jgi:hypothetical protein
MRADAFEEPEEDCGCIRSDRYRDPSIRNSPLLGRDPCFFDSKEIKQK